MGFLISNKTSDEPAEEEEDILYGGWYRGVFNNAPKMSDKPVGATHPTNSFGRTIRARGDIGISSPFVFT